MKKNVHFLWSVIILILSSMITNISAQAVGNPAPDFTLESIDNQTFTLSAHEGNLVVIFSFGFSCGNCKYSAPLIEKEIYQKYKKYENIEVIGMDVWDGKVSDVINFKNTTQVTFPLLYSAGAVGIKYGSSNDKLLVVDDKGILVHKSTSPAYADIDDVKIKINEFLQITTGIDPLYNKNNNSIVSYPNPFNDETKIIYYLDGKSHVRLTLIDISGNTVKILEEANNEAGEHKIELKRESLSSGYYFLKLETNNNVNIHKLIIN